MRIKGSIAGDGGCLLRFTHYCDTKEALCERRRTGLRFVSEKHRSSRPVKLESRLRHKAHIYGRRSATRPYCRPHRQTEEPLSNIAILPKMGAKKRGNHSGGKFTHE